jgi:hypothetical protein
MLKKHGEREMAHQLCRIVRGGGGA